MFGGTGRFPSIRASALAYRFRQSLSLLPVVIVVGAGSRRDAQLMPAGCLLFTDSTPGLAKLVV